MIQANWLAALVLAFSAGLGVVPFSRFIARLFRKRSVAELTLWPGFALAALLDFSKGALAVLVAAPDGLMMSSRFAAEAGYTPGPGFAWKAALAVVAGHAFGPWFDSRSDRAAMVACGALAFLSPISAGAGGVVYLGVFFATRLRALASVAALGIAVATFLVFYSLESYHWAAFVAAFVVLLKHESDLDDLILAQE